LQLRDLLTRERRYIYNIESSFKSITIGEVGMAMGSKRLVLTGGTVIKGTDEAAMHDAAVEIKNGRILDVSQEPTARNQNETQVIDISGMSVLPGLIDIHTHNVTRFEAVQKLLLSHGVTSVREVEVSTESVVSRFRMRIRARRKASPRVFLTGPLFDSTPKKGSLTIPSARFLTKPIIIDNETFARLEVEKARKAGADVIEVNFNIDGNVMKAIVSSAEELRIPVFGDFLFSRRTFASHAMEAGIKALDHASGIAQLFCNNVDQVGFFEEWESAIEEKVLAFAQNLSRTGVFLIPTLVWFEAQSKLARQSINSVPLFELLPEQIRKMWMNPNPLFGMEKWMRGAEASFEKLKKFLGVFARYGGKVVTGTDSPLYFVYPGASVLREIELLVTSNLTPIQAIQAATRNPAELLNANNIGTIEKGKSADLLVVEGNPLKDINDIHKTKMVIKDGRIYYPQKLLESIGKSPFSWILEALSN
jgi:hypothetical protein